MKDNYQIAAVAQLIADPGRCMMLMTLMDGRAYTAGELAGVASIRAQTASVHLGKLLDGGLVSAVKQGRCKYFRLASTLVADTLESLLRLQAASESYKPKAPPKSSCPTLLRSARTCYDHLAGELGVKLYDAFVSNGFIEVGDDRLGLTGEGRQALIAMGLSEKSLIEKPSKPLLRSCMDWSQRRSHLAGPLARELLNHFIAQGWLSVVEGSRQLTVTAAGRRYFKSLQVDIFS